MFYYYIPLRVEGQENLDEIITFHLYRDTGKQIVKVKSVAMPKNIAQFVLNTSKNPIHLIYGLKLNIKLNEIGK